jgi:hypothetical protein
MIPISENHPDQKPDSVAPSKGRRLLAIFCLFWYALLGWLRFYQAQVHQAYFSELRIWPGPLYIALSGLLIGLFFSLAVILLIIKVRFAPPYTRMTGMLFLGWLWFDHIWLGKREAFNHQLVINILISLVTGWIVFILIRNQDYGKEETHDKQ